MTMTRKTFARFIVVVLIAAVLGGAYLIVANNKTAAMSERETPSGFLH
jgi:CHASE3 domain sensor protein